MSALTRVSIRIAVVSTDVYISISYTLWRKRIGNGNFGLLVSAFAGRLNVNACYQKLYDLSFCLRIALSLDLFKAILKLRQECSRIPILGFVGLRQIILGLHSAQRCTQVCRFSFDGFKLKFCIFQGCAPATKQRHDTVSLKRLLGKRLLQPLLLCREFLALAQSLV